jgi:L-ascorbate metabolism protein UlaG (beta-lactamase superfamily)
VKIKWYGQAAFLLTSDAGTKIITDPYTPGGFGLNYGDIAESADIVTVSHDHADHSNVAGVKGSPKVVRGAADVKGIKISAVPAYHDASGGKERGGNIIFCFDIDGLRVCHVGDLGHDLSEKQVKDIGKVDILLIPVGGNFTIDAAAATRVGGVLAPKIIIPMHYQNDRCPDFPVAGVDGFLKGKENVTRLEVSEAEFHAGKLPAAAQIVVLKPAR